jgi:GPH family glycoside/pentoside/hexuronide:cation symporter
MALFLAMLWFPPDDHVTRANTVWIGIGMAGVWFTYTAVVAPYLSLLPEITPYANERVTLSTMMSVADVLGMILMSVVIGTVIEGFSGGLALGPLVMKDGYQVAGVLTAIVMAGCFFASVLFVKENPTGEIKPVEFSFGEAAAACLKNPAFWPYILAVTVLRFGVDLLVGMIPFMVVGLMGYREGTAGALQGVIILLAAVFLPLVAARANKRGKKRIFAEALVWFAIVLPLLGLVWHAPFVGWGVALVARLFGVTMTHPQVMIAHVAGLFVASAVPISAIITLTRPLIADIMDHDEKLTGYRREAMYNGMEGLLTKTSQGLAWALLPVLMTYAGNTPSRPWGVVATGPICGLAVFLGWLSFRRHPFDY